MKFTLIIILALQFTNLFAQRDLRFMFDKELIPENLISANHYDSLIITSTNKFTSEEKIHTIVHFNNNGQTTKIRIPYRNEGLFTLWEYKYGSVNKLLLHEVNWRNDGIPSLEIFHIYEELDSTNLLKTLGLISFPESNYKLVYHYEDSTESIEYKGEYRTVEKYRNGNIISVQNFSNDKVYEQKIYTYHSNGLIQSYRNELLEKTELYEYEESGLLLKKFILPPVNQKPAKQEMASNEFEIEIEFPTEKKEVPIYNELSVLNDTLILKQNFGSITPRIQRLVKIGGHKKIPYWFQSKVSQNNGVQNTTFDENGNLIFNSGIKYSYN